MSTVDERLGSTDRNRAQRHAKIDNAVDRSIRMLLDGLEVDSIQSLKAIVDAARRVSTVYEARSIRAASGDVDPELWDLVTALHDLGRVLAA